MCTQFYGLREKPFSLSPDPRYLFLADPHREALAHLLYGIEQGEGFICVTGEVGTGKTTLCRTLLGRLEAGTEVAFIFNPQLSGLELLQAINAELGLPVEGLDRRQLHEQLNRFLLAKRRDGRKVLLIIDEFSALAMDADAANLFERVRSFGAAVIVSSQSFAGLGEGAERILDAAAGVLCHQGADPERLAARAGTRRMMERTIQVADGGHPTGHGTVRAQETFRVHPDQIRQLPVGECYLIAQGRALRVRVTSLRLDASHVAADKREDVIR